MTSSVRSARLIAAGRGVMPWLVGPVALALRDRSLELASPSACPGLLEILSITSLRFDPDLAIGPVFAALRGAAIVVGLAVFVALVFRRTRQMRLAAATGLAVGLSPLFAATLSPPWEAAAFGVCAAGALLVGPLLEPRRQSPRAFAFASLSLLLAAALLVPPWLAIAAVGSFLAISAAVSRRGRLGRSVAGGVAAAGLVVAAVSLLILSSPEAFDGQSSWQALAACTLPRPSASRAIVSAGSILWTFGPFPLALAALGLFGEAQRAGWQRSFLVAGVAALCLVLAASAGLNPQTALAPSAVGLWWLAALGMKDLLTALDRKPVFKFVGVLILLLLPALEASRVRTEERDDWVRPRGHDTLALRHMRAVLSQVSSSATFVEEDATVDLLLRAATTGRRRTSRSIAIVPARAEVVRLALESGPVYVFPRQQENLSQRGFRIAPLAVTAFRRDNSSEQIGGVATIVATRRCEVIGTAWIDLADVGAQGRIAMAADVEAARGPITIYLGGAMAAQPAPDGWPERTTRGFVFGLLDQRTGKRSDRLMAEAQGLGLPPDHAVLAEPYVIRLTLHRTPRAPRALAITLGASFPVGVARLESSGANAASLTVCEAPPMEILPLGPRG